MNVRSLATLATAAGACLVGTAPAADTTAKKAATKTTPTKATTKAMPVAGPTVGNQQLADEVAARLTATGAAQMADVSVSVADGVVTLMGTCRDAATKDMVIQQVRTIGGVKKVRDGMTAGTGIMQAQAAGPIGLPTSGPMAAPMTLGQIPSGSGLGGAMIDPVPLGAAGAGAADMSAPNLPPYAWPTYAPHNNVSRVAYPQAYPYNAFPFIGPFYPFPKVPLGWRSVLLQWEDGHWWIGKTAAPHDYWRVRFW